MIIHELKPYKHPYASLASIGDRVKGKVIYKYMPFDSALKCLENNNIRFHFPTKWDDPFEKYFFNANYDNVMPNPTFETRLYACCLTQNSDCEAAWKMYTKDYKNNPCVQFKIYLGQFRRFADQFVHGIKGHLYEGRAYYGLSENEILHLYKRRSKNYQVFFSNFNLREYLNLMLLKRPFFKYEGEVRYMVHSETLSFDNDYLDIKMPWSLCLYSVKLPPNCSLDRKNELEAALEANYKLCMKDYKGYYSQRIPPVDNSLYNSLQMLTIEPN